MLNSLFTSTTIPVLEDVARFSQLRHTTLAGNIANLDTPGYQFRDLSVDDFQSRLQEAIELRREQRKPDGSGRYAMYKSPLLASVAERPPTLLYHDKSNVELEQQVSEMVKNHMQHNLALTVMNQQFRLLTTAISGRL